MEGTPREVGPGKAGQGTVAQCGVTSDGQRCLKNVAPALGRAVQRCGGLAPSGTPLSARRPLCSATSAPPRLTVPARLRATFG